MATDPYRHSFAVGDRVKILTPAGGCYNAAAGTVAQKLDNALQPYPDGQEPDIPDFYCVRTDKPVDIGDGTLTVTDVHPARQVFAIKSPVRNYWDIRQKN